MGELLEGREGRKGRAGFANATPRQGGTALLSFALGVHTWSQAHHGLVPSVPWVAQVPQVPSYEQSPAGSRDAPATFAWGRYRGRVLPFDILTRSYFDIAPLVAE